MIKRYENAFFFSETSSMLKYTKLNLANFYLLEKL